MITREFLRSEIEKLEAQKANALATLNAAGGAIHAYQALIAKIDKDEAAIAASQAADG